MVAPRFPVYTLPSFVVPRIFCDSFVPLETAMQQMPPSSPPFATFQRGE